MSSKHQVRDKIRATGSIRQITRAMELVAATKMRRSQNIALSARPYAKEALELLRNLLLHREKEGELSGSHFFKQTGKKNVCLAVVTSDKGLAGPYNAAVLRQAWKFLAQNPRAELVVAGKRGKIFFEKRGKTVTASFFQFSDIATLQDILPLADFLLSSYESHRYDSVVFCSTMFLSAFNQKVEFNEILPLQIEELEKIIRGIVPRTGKYSELRDEKNEPVLPYVLEPSNMEIFEGFVRELVKIEILHLVFEANASEHSSRMIAMKSATEAADTMLENLALLLNKARQAGITQELAEVSSAREALIQE